MMSGRNAGRDAAPIIDKRDVSLLIHLEGKASSSSNGTDTGTHKTWQVSQVVQRLVRIAVPGDKQPQLGCDKSLTNFVASLCWIFQKAALLDGSLRSMDGDGGYSNREDEDDDVIPRRQFTHSHSVELPVFAIALTACNSDLSLVEELSCLNSGAASEQAGTSRLVDYIQFWLCDTCSEYVASEKGSLTHVTTYQHVIQNLRCHFLATHIHFHMLFLLSCLPERMFVLLICEACALCFALLTLEWRGKVPWQALCSAVTCLHVPTHLWRAMAQPQMLRLWLYCSNCWVPSRARGICSADHSCPSSSILSAMRSALM
jgi:hypothetical protein